MRVTRVSPARAATGQPHTKPAKARWVWWPSMGVKSQKGSVGLQGSLLQAPAGGLGVYFKTSASWGGRSSPLGPNASNASMGEPP